MIIGAWMQHPSADFLDDPIFEFLPRWAHGQRVFGLARPERSLDG